MTLDPFPDPATLRAMARRRGVVLPDETAAPKARQPRPYAPYRSKWEWEYAEYLDRLVAAKRVLVWRYEPERLEIGVGAKYTPDFSVLLPGAERVEYREVKGYRREASIVRIKAAALRYPLFRFVLVTKRNGHWHHQPITPLAEVEG